MKSIISEGSERLLSVISELNYLTHFVIKLYVNCLLITEGLLLRDQSSQ